MTIRFPLSLCLRLGCLILGCLVLSPPVFPHALDPESIDRHAEITLTPDRAIVIYEVILGLMPTSRAASDLDTDQDKNISDEERNAYLDSIAPQYAKGQTLQIGEFTLPLKYMQGDTYRTAGHNGINVIKIDLGFICELPAGIPRETTLPFHYHDANLDNLNGWKQIKFNAIQNVRFSGHLPYKDFGKFDYTIIETKGFIPKTETINIEVYLPPQTATPAQAAIVMPEKDVYDIKKITSGLDLLLQVWMILGGVIVVIAGVYFWFRRSQTFPNSE